MTTPRIYQAFIVLMVALYFLLPATRMIAFPFNLLGIIVFAYGAYLALLSKKCFLSRGTPMAPDAPLPYG